MTEDLTRGDTEDAGAESQSFTGAEGAEQLIGQASVMVGRPAPGALVYAFALAMVDRPRFIRSP